MPIQARTRTALAFTHDIAAVAAAWLAAYWLRFNFETLPALSEPLWQTLWWVIPVHVLVAWQVGLYRGLWRFASLTDLKRIVAAVGIAALLVGVAVTLLSLQNSIPRTVLVLYPLLLLCLMSGSRIAYRIFKEYRLYGHAHLAAEPVLVLGAGEAATSLVRELRRSLAWHVVGFLDDDAAMQGRDIDGVKVFGRIDQLPQVAQRLGTRIVIVALPGATAAIRRRAIEIADAAGLTVMTVPAIADLLAGRLTISQIRRVELEDLLGREAISLDAEGLHQLITGNTVLITGAGGSIGAELCRQVAAFAPQRMVLIELSELALYQMEQEFAQRFPGVALTCLIGDVRDARRLDEIFARWQPRVVLHAAAYKHVPLMEHGNLWEVLSNNILGTLTVARTSIRHRSEKFVFISTDKAVNPTSIMGVSKRLAELALQALQEDAGHTSFVVVRFGNVLGSTGSVIPKFAAQIAAGGPVTVTHPDIIRYFMTIPEAAQLVLQAGLMGDHGEIFVLDMGDPVRIVDLARDMIRLSGMSEDDIPIVFTGLRPGEKLYEELLADVEQTAPTRHPKLRIFLSGAIPHADWAVALENWLREQHERDEDVIRRQLQAWVPEYAPPGSADNAGQTGGQHP